MFVSAVSGAQDDPNATCAFWDENLAKWSTEGVETLPSEGLGTLVCSTRHLSIFGGVVSVVLTLGIPWPTLGGKVLLSDAFTTGFTRNQMR